ncbi:hypothetical protein [Aquimarina intermedia]|uniref:Uncharacterized protein n=1 Tax=Aquimarina intermedia TaxID=350814 RepID=A0A5S5BWW7_9FLAO|nr:hypothetical protein [Aquimarina intermedia]TYP71527.1 hypothetical protein BD809_109109 [Aquimarina intermedia]
MQLLAKNFSGQLECGSKYRIVEIIKGNSIVLVLKVYNEILESYHYTDLVAKSFDDDNFKEMILECLKEAQEKWKIQLIKSQLTKVA